MDIDGSGKKNDVDDRKVRLDLIPPCFTEGMGQVLLLGAEKYGADNWMRGIDFRRIIGGLKRHTLAIEQGSDFDLESGVQHAFHIGCCASFLSHYIENWTDYRQFDDRIFAGRPDALHIPSSDNVQHDGKITRRRDRANDKPNQD